MAKCDEGYLCDVCGEEVTSIVESDLYLRYVIGQLDAEQLHVSPERHLRCNPTLAQYIEDPRLAPIEADGEFDRRKLDTAFVEEQSDLISCGYRRLWEISNSDIPISLLDYPIATDEKAT